MSRYHKILTGKLLAGCFLTLAATASAAYPAGYYDSLDGKCGRALMSAVKSICADHKVISYGNGTWNAFKDTDVRTVDGVDYWWDMYSDGRVRVSEGRPDNSVMNIEHSVAKSWWGGSKNEAHNDIVHLNPSNSNANSRKSNYPMSEVGNVDWTNGYTIIGYPKSGQGGGAKWAYEPCDEYKGDFARVFMYMFCTYDDISWKDGTDWMYDTSDPLMFKKWAADLLLRWSAGDPVSEKERVRNDGIYKNQNNRNPFIDFPDLADHIWGSKSSVPFHLDGEHGGDDPGTNPGGDDPSKPEDPNADIDITWLPATDTALDPSWIIVNEKLSSGLTYIWKWSDTMGNGKYYLKGSAYVDGTPLEGSAYAISPVVSLENCKEARISFDHTAKFQKNLRTMCKFIVREEGTEGHGTEVAIPQWPEPDSWNFVSSGDIDLSAWLGKKIQVGFLYQSDSNGADTWEVKNVRLRAVRNAGEDPKDPEDPEDPKDPEDPEDPGVNGVDNIGDDSFLVEVWGNTIAVPEGARIFDLNGREVSGESVQRGVYIVTKPTFRKAVKVLVK